MQRSIIIAAILALTAGAVTAQVDIIKNRQTIMKGVGKATGELFKVMKGEASFDLKQAQDVRRSVPQLVVVDFKTEDLAIACQHLRLRLDFLRHKHAAHWRKSWVAVQIFEIPSEQIGRAHV